MPTYEYEREDGTRFETQQSINDDALKTCPTTGQAVKRLISSTSFQLKGSGWYKTDYSSSGSSGSSSSTSSGSSPAVNSKPETAPKTAEKATTTAPTKE